MMDREPLLPITTPTPIPNIITARGGGAIWSRKLTPTFGTPPPPFFLTPLPEDAEVTIPPSSPAPSPSASSSSLLKERLIFGPSTPLSSSPVDPAGAAFFSSNCSPPPSPSRGTAQSAAAAADDSWLIDPSAGGRWKSNLHRSVTAPAMATLHEIIRPHRGGDDDSPQRPSIVGQAILLLLIYLALGVAIYTFNRGHFAVSETHPVVDALYFCIVTMCTIGYGDITPITPSAKLFSITFVLVGFGFIDILLSGMVSYVLDLQESLILSTAAKKLPPGAAPHQPRPGVDENTKKQSQQHRNRHRQDIARRYLVDVKKGRMRIRMKVAIALGVVLLCISVGIAVLRFVERLNWLDAFYLSVMSVTTVGYGDRAFRTLPGRLFASLWLLVSTLAVARAFLYLAEARIDKRHRKIAKWVLCRDMTVSEFLEADIDHNGFVTKSEFVIYKLKEMGKISEKDIMTVVEQFDRLDPGNCGKITLSDLIQSPS